VLLAPGCQVLAGLSQVLAVGVHLDGGLMALGGLMVLGPPALMFLGTHLASLTDNLVAGVGFPTLSIVASIARHAVLCQTVPVWHRVGSLEV
jgi:hypothetical protein